MGDVGDTVGTFGGLFGVGSEDGVELGYFFEGGEVGEDKDYAWDATDEEFSSWADRVC